MSSENAENLNKNLNRKRFFKNKLSLKFDSINQVSQSQKENKYFANNQISIPIKLNFHQLLSIPLEKQIKKENSLKQNQTFYLKFQSQSIKKQITHYSKENLSKNASSNVKFFSRINLTAKKTSKKADLPKQYFRSIKEISKTMHFKPIGQKAQYSEQIIKKESQQYCKDKENQRFKLGSSPYKDNLLMLLQIRKQYRNQQQKLEQMNSFNNGLNSERPTNQPAIFGNLRPKIGRSESFRERRRKVYEQSTEFIKQIKKGKQKTNKGNEQSSNQLSPWYLIQNAEEF